MDGVWQLNESELSSVIAYVHSLGRIARVNLPGDSARGKQVSAESGCASCHITSGTGRAIGPELTAIGAQRSAAYLRESLLNPGAVVPEEFASVVIEQRDGTQLKAIRVNEDTFTIQVRDLTGEYRSFRKSGVSRILRPEGVSYMPAYSNLSAADLDGLVAYLASLRGDL